MPTYAKVRYKDVYPGIDLVYHGNRGQIEYDFVVGPGADPNVIRLAFDGMDEIVLDGTGNLMVRVAGGDLVQHAPIIYQEMDGKRQRIPGGYSLLGEGRVRTRAT